MAEYIDRGALLRAIEELNDGENWIVNQYNADWIYSFIDAAPTADVVEVRHAAKANSAISKTGLMCTACHSDVDRDAVWCKYCGSKMDGKDGKI